MTIKFYNKARKGVKSVRGEPVRYPVLEVVNSVDRALRYCQYYDPHAVLHMSSTSANGKCKANVTYSDVMVQDQMPCIDGHLLGSPTSYCSKWCQRTLKQATEIYEMYSRKTTLLKSAKKS